jgi:Transglutaminase-like superfamily
MNSRSTSMCRISFVVCWIAGLMTVQAQPAIWKEMKEKFPDESAVFISRDKVITLEVEGDSLQASAVINETILFLKDRPDDANDMRIFGSHFQEVQNLQAKTLVWEKSRYKDIPLSGLTRQREDDNDIFYDDSYFYQMSFPAAHAGNQATWSFTERYRDVRFLPSFYFQDYLPQAKGSFVIRAPHGVEIKWHILNDADKRIQFKQYTKGQLTYYEWVSTNIPAFKREEQSPKYAYFSPLVVFHVTSWKTKDATRPLLSSLDDLHRWYTETLQAALEEPTPGLTEIVKQLVQPGDQEIDKVKKVFYWVQDNIRYIAFEDGMRGLVPHKPSYVLEKRYGDCKDMASLIVGMLQAAGVKSYYTWIGTRDIPYRYSFIPSPLVDNHMIATYIDASGNYYFLDGTSNYTSLSLPSSMIQGKEAFISMGPAKWEVKEVPVIGAQKSLKVDSVYLQIEAGTLMGKGNALLSGYQKINASYDFNQTQANRQKDNVVDWVKKGSNKFYLDDYQIHHVQDKDLPLQLTYKFRLSDYVTYAGSEMFINLNLEKNYYNQLIAAGRKIPYNYSYQYAVDNQYVLEIPTGYEIEYLPASRHHEGPVLSFESNYRQSGSRIILSSKLSRHTLLLEADQFNNWNTAIRELSAAYKESIILKKKSP